MSFILFYDKEFKIQILSMFRSTMFRKISGSFYTFVKKNSAGFTILTSAIGIQQFLSIQKVHAKSTDIDLSDAVAESLTDSDLIESNSDKMKYRMEAFITNLQGKLVKQLEEIEGGSKFRVDRWLREEVGSKVFFEVFKIIIKLLREVEELRVSCKMEKYLKELLLIFQ